MGLLFRIALILVVAAAIISVVRGLAAMLMPAPSRRMGTSGQLVKDPVCGTYIPQETAIRARDHFFCSEACRGQFLKG